MTLALAAPPRPALPRPWALRRHGSREWRYHYSMLASFQVKRRIWRRRERRHFSNRPSATMQTNHRIPQVIVILSRLRSTTDDDPSDEDMPPPNRSESPPPLPLCSSTSSTMSRLVMIRTTENAITTTSSSLQAHRSRQLPSPG